MNLFFEICKLANCDRATPFYSNLGILKLVNLGKFEKAIFAFKNRLKPLPAQFIDYLTEINNIYKISARSIIKKITLFYL